MPDESAFNSAAKWKIHIPDVESTTVSDVLLRISYQGDIARVYTQGTLFTDDFPDRIHFQGIEPPGEVQIIKEKPMRCVKVREAIDGAFVDGSACARRLNAGHVRVQVGEQIPLHSSNPLVLP